MSTPADYIRFVQMLANHGDLYGKRLLQATTVDSLTFPHVLSNSPGMTSVQGSGWANGFHVQVAPDITAVGGGGHDGLYWMSGAANLFMWVDPSVGVVGMVWAQATPYRVYPLFTDVRRVVANAFTR